MYFKNADSELPPITHVWSSFGHRFISDDSDSGHESCLTCGAMYELVRRADDPTGGDYTASNGDDPTPCTRRTDLYHGVPGEGEGATDHNCNCLFCA